MYEDAKQELQRLEEALLAEDEPELEAEEIPAYNTDKTDTDLEQFAQEVLDGEKKSMTGLVALAAALAGAVVVALVIFLLRWKGLMA